MSTAAKASRLYAPYKAVGFVTDGQPLSIQRKGREVFVAASVNRQIHIYRYDKLSSAIATRFAPAPITRIATKNQLVYAACGAAICVFKRQLLVSELGTHDEPIVDMMLLGDVLLTVCAGNVLKVWDTKARKLVHDITLLREARATVLCHPASYLNKILIGFEDGGLELWNIRTRTLIYTFESHAPYVGFLGTDQTNDDDEDDDRDHRAPQQVVAAGVTAIEQSPAPDVVAIGFTNGFISIVNVKYDKQLFRFKAEAGGRVRSLSFRTDAASEQTPYLASGHDDGRIFIWHLLHRRLQFCMEDAHSAAIGTVKFMEGEPILLTNSADNSIKCWIFDAPDGSARLLRGRSGHSAHPRKIQYYGGHTMESLRDNATAMSCDIVSAGSDGTLRLFNHAREVQNMEYSQKQLLKKLGVRYRNASLPPVRNFALCETRGRDWGTIVTIHDGHSDAYVWKHKQKAATELVLRQPDWKHNTLRYTPDASTHATSVCISSCGNFALIGTKGGQVYKYNVQSGLPRGSYPKQRVSSRRQAMKPGSVFKLVHDAGMHTQPKADQEAGAVPEETLVGHSREVTGVEVDALNEVVISSSLDGRLIFWDFSTHAYVDHIQLDTGISSIKMLRESGLIAAVCDDLVVRVYDFSTHKLVRRFAGHTGEITDAVFTPDGRRLLTCSSDSTVRVWDLLTGRCLDWIRFDTPVISMALSLAGEYLCMVHTDREGIFMYSDRSLYENVFISSEPSKPITITAPSIVGEDNADSDKPASPTSVANPDGDDLEDDSASANPQDDEHHVDESPEQRGEDALTLSALPRAYWTTLFNLELIKERNKPVQPPSAPEKAPFFLPTLHKESANPSFPTLDEFQALQNKKRTSGPEAAADEHSAKKAKSDETKAAEEHGDDDLAGWEGMNAGGGVWSDDDDESDGNEDGDSKDDGGKSTSGKRQREEPPASRILSKRSSALGIGLDAPRCRLALLLEEMVGPSDHHGHQRLTEQLKTMTPPTIDVEMRSLHRGADDSTGDELLYLMLQYFQRQLEDGTDFEVTQAYLHRFLTIYSNLIQQNARLAAAAATVSAVQLKASTKFRELINENLCILKFVGKLQQI